MRRTLKHTLRNIQIQKVRATLHYFNLISRNIKLY